MIPTSYNLRTKKLIPSKEQIIQYSKDRGRLEGMSHFHKSRAKTQKRVDAFVRTYGYYWIVK